MPKSSPGRGTIFAHIPKLTRVVLEPFILLQSPLHLGSGGVQCPVSEELVDPMQNGKAEDVGLAVLDLPFYSGSLHGYFLRAKTHGEVVPSDVFHCSLWEMQFCLLCWFVRSSVCYLCGKINPRFQEVLCTLVS